MKIESVEKYKGSCFEIEFSDGTKKYLHSDLVSRYSLSPEKEVSEEEWEEIQYASDFRRAKERALYLLEDRDHSFCELYEKLERTYPEDIALEVTQKMVSLGLINDRRYGERLTRQLVEGKRYGAFRVRMELSRRGIDDDLIDELLEPYEDDTEDRLEEFARRKYYSILTDEKGVRKAKAALVRNGYSYRDVNAVIGRLIEELEEQEDE